jgi:hypothetical protein
MRVTITHQRRKPEVMDAVNRSIGQLFSGVAVGPLEFTDQENKWTGDRMFFSLNAKMGPIKAPIKGFVDVGETDVTVDVDLGVFGKFISEQSARNQVEGRIKALIAK